MTHRISPVAFCFNVIQHELSSKMTRIPFICGLFFCCFFVHVLGLRNFRVIQETVKVNVSSPDLIEDATIYIKKYNRTFDALNSTATFKQWLNDSIFITVRSFEWKGNRYQRSFLDVKLDYCRFLANPAKTNILFALFYTETTKKFGNFPKKCPVAPGVYYIHNMNVNSEAFPPYFPPNRYQFVVEVLHKTQPLFTTTIRYRIEPKGLFED